MTTIKVKFRPSTVAGKSGTVYYQLCHNGEIKQLKSGIHIDARYWDINKECIRDDSDNTRIQAHKFKIDSDLSRFKHIINELENRGRDYSLQDIVEEFKSSDTYASISSFFEEMIESCKRNRRIGTATNYRRTLSSFMNFLNNRDIPFTLITENMIENYEKWLSDKSISRNSSSYYMRNLRSVYNKAVRRGLTSQNNPFKNVYTGIGHTKKRAINESTILKMMKLDLDYSRPLALSRDLFVFSYCARGMAFIDIAFLKKADISDGVISYMRHKTNQQLNIKVEPCIEKIINRYAEDTKETPYVFPIITKTNLEDATKEYQTKLGYHNRKLKRIGKLLGEDLSLSSYTARHTWATTARNHNVPISVISAGMGHTSEKTTQIYLASLENSVVDKANEELMRDFNSAISS